MRYETGVLVASVLTACGPSVASLPAGTSSSGPSTTTTTASTDPNPSTSSTSITTDATMSVDSTSADDAPTLPPDFGSLDDCDLWLQNCPPDHKCVPYPTAPWDEWNATRCAPIVADPQAIGEPCTEMGAESGPRDDCGLGALCFDSPWGAGSGECTAFCEGSERDPHCPECTACYINPTGLITLCTSPCEPIVQDCRDGSACYPYLNRHFACAPDVSLELGAPGDPCDFINVCDPGTFCAEPERVPGCENEGGCCAPFCTVGDDTPCAALPGTTCVPWRDREPFEGCVADGMLGACEEAR